MSKEWVINVQVNTEFMEDHFRNEGKGSWDRPLGTHINWGNNVLMTAISDEPSDEVQTGNGDSFELAVRKGDVIKWVVSEINPVQSKGRTVCMYGFSQGANWKANLTSPHIADEEVCHMELLAGFNHEQKPQQRFLESSLADLSVPHTKVRSNADGGRVKYLMKLLLVDISDPKEPVVLKYTQVDPWINIIPS